MPKSGGSKGAGGANGLTYIAQKPSFLQNFGKAPSDPSSSRSGREPLPERPSEGDWAAGSDEEDEWEGQYGGGEDGPQVVVLKQGKHLSQEELERERRRATGRPSASPPPKAAKKAEPPPAASHKSVMNKASSAAPSKPKRKLVGEAAAVEPKMNGKPNKKKKAGKGLLSFNEAEEDS